MLDCGMHMGYNDERRFPDFSYITRAGRLTQHLDCVIIRQLGRKLAFEDEDNDRGFVLDNHFHLDHCGALPYFSEMVGYDGPIYMTHPTKAICPILLMIKDCMKKVITVNLHQTVKVDDELEIKAYYAGHVLGAAMFHMKVGTESLVYTGDYNMTPDRHLGAAWIDKCRPDVLITESTYATTIRDSKRCRERDFLKKVHESMDKGGKVLIPVFALGRAQELCILLETYWDRMNLKAPIYFSTGLTEKNLLLLQYQSNCGVTTRNISFGLYLEKMILGKPLLQVICDLDKPKNKEHICPKEHVRFQTYQETLELLAKLKHLLLMDLESPSLQPVLVLPVSYIDNPGPMVVFATPGMLHAGLSLQIFKKWAADEKNMVVIPGYCVAGTVGHKVLSGQKKIELDKKSVIDVKLSVQYMSFSAHADAKGIMQLIRQAEPKNVVLVHGEAGKMDFLKQQIEKEFGIGCFKPANGETVCMETIPTIAVDMSLALLKRKVMSLEKKDAKRAKLTPHNNHLPVQGVLVMKDTSVRLVEPAQAMKELGLTEHKLRFTSSVTLETTIPYHMFIEKLQSQLKRLLPNYSVQRVAEGCLSVDDSVLIKISGSSDDVTHEASNCTALVSWTLQEEELGSHVLSLLRDRITRPLLPFGESGE
ncbi:hypothetical protein pdam_00006394 [Pocillopora damicornis]|uniref:Integrator complex subunit 11 n=1 Tax=Pocillopora damicornis TaxID=46731 RepID=A0A3M6TQM9_POCDA|nr:hypothetical protein pdam_00006394 [Pocillopora damicornis]